MNKKLYKIAAALRIVGHTKTAQQVLDLLEKRRQRDLKREHNRQVLKQMKNEDRDQAILEQHRLDRPLLRNPETELSYPGAQGTPGRRYEVYVSYPSFDEAGAPYFDEESVSEVLSITENELEDLKRDEQIGGIKIHSVKPLLPKKK